MSKHNQQTSAYALTGMPAAGKTTTAQMLSAVDFQVYEIGDAVRYIIKDYEHDISEIGPFLEDHKSKHGQYSLAERTVDLYEEDQPTNKVPVIAGLRQVEEREYLEDKFDNVDTFAVIADQDIRRERFYNRGREEDESFEERDIREWNIGVGDLTRESDRRIENEGSFEDLAMELIETFDFNPNLYSINKIGDSVGQHLYAIHFENHKDAKKYSENPGNGFQVGNPIVSRDTESRHQIETDIQNFYTNMMTEAVK